MGAHSRKPNKPSGLARFLSVPRLFPALVVLFFVCAIGVGLYLYANTSSVTAVGKVVPVPAVTDPTNVEIIPPSSPPTSTKRPKSTRIAPTDPNQGS